MRTQAVSRESLSLKSKQSLKINRKSTLTKGFANAVEEQKEIARNTFKIRRHLNNLPQDDIISMYKQVFSERVLVNVHLKRHLQALKEQLAEQDRSRNVAPFSELMSQKMKKTDFVVHMKTTTKAYELEENQRECLDFAYVRTVTDLEILKRSIDRLAFFMRRVEINREKAQRLKTASRFNSKRKGIELQDISMNVTLKTKELEFKSTNLADAEKRLKINIGFNEENNAMIQLRFKALAEENEQLKEELGRLDESRERVLQTRQSMADKQGNFMVLLRKIIDFSAQKNPEIFKIAVDVVSSRIESRENDGQILRQLQKSESMPIETISRVHESLTDASAVLLTEIMLSVFAELVFSLAQKMKYCGELQRELCQKVRRLQEKNELLEEEMNKNEVEKTHEGLQLSVATKRTALRRLESSLGFLFLLGNYLDVFGLKIKRLGKVLRIILPEQNRFAAPVIAGLSQNSNNRENRLERRIDFVGTPKIESQTFLDRPQSDLAREWIIQRFPMLKTPELETQNPFYFYQTFSNHTQLLLNYFVTLDRELDWFRDHLLIFETENDPRREQLKFIESISNKGANKRNSTLLLHEHHKTDFQAVSLEVP